MMRRVYFILALLAAPLAALDVEGAEGKVLTMTGENAEALIEAHPNMLVKFFAPWCGHCKAMKADFEEAAEELKGKAVLVDCDATAETELAENFPEIEGFPTLIWFQGSMENRVEFDGERTAADIVAWVNTMTGDAIKTVAEDEVPEEAKAGKPLVVVTAPALPEGMEEAAKKIRRVASFYYVEGGESKITLRHKGSDAVETSEVTGEGLLALVEKNRLPLVGLVGQDTFTPYFESSKGLIWYLFSMQEYGENADADEVAKNYMEDMRGIAEANLEKYHVVYTDLNLYSEAIEDLLGVRDFPQVVVHTNQGRAGERKYPFPGAELNVEEVNKFVARVDAGEVEPLLKSEEAPEEPQTEPVKVIVGKTLETMVFQKDRDVLLEIYAPWCGHCKSLAPDYEKVAKRVQKEGLEDVLMVAKMDGAANESPLESISWSGFPTILYIPAGSDTPLDVEDRSAEGIWEWINSNESKNAQLAERLKELKQAEEEGEKTEHDEL